eukprot:scaffold20540_cov101-Isochrysis_galbana.AAC.1
MLIPVSRIGICEYKMHPCAPASVRAQRDGGQRCDTETKRPCSMLSNMSWNPISYSIAAILWQRNGC